ncbi:MAG TPA: UDP-3-O-(3-hydroxymyristoyl)glucosamine N-acyltransferase [Xanthobacteraceae bacterium]|nr:UDP-3-O-(3-hydroxymyristoyl)glucosamine N-acyltransferase [Xanthobacteraceae bacterium]
MSEPRFHHSARALSLGEVAAMAGVELPAGVPANRCITGIAALDQAGPTDLAFIDSPKYTRELRATRAGICLASPRYAAEVPATSVALVTPQPYRVFVAAACALFPDSLRPSTLFRTDGIAPGAHVSPDAVLESGVSVDPGAVVGPGAEIGSGTAIAAGAVIGPGVRIGRDCAIGPGATITHALIGDRVIIHPGCRIGQDGFGYVMGPHGHRKVPQVGRVIIQDDVEIGANTAIDRGANRDTVIGEGTKIDNLVQVGHNVSIGRHCVIVAQSGISGSSTLGDFVVLGARVGLNDHITIGEGAQIAAVSAVGRSVPPGARWGGTPARPAHLWLRELRMLAQMARAQRGASGAEKDAAEP